MCAFNHVLLTVATVGSKGLRVNLLKGLLRHIIAWGVWWWFSNGKSAFLPPFQVPPVETRRLGLAWLLSRWLVRSDRHFHVVNSFSAKWIVPSALLFTRGAIMWRLISWKQGRLKIGIAEMLADMAWSGRYAAEMFQITGLSVAWLPRTLCYTPEALSPCLSSKFPMFIPSFSMSFGRFALYNYIFVSWWQECFQVILEMLISGGWPKLHSSYS